MTLHLAEAFCIGSQGGGPEADHLMARLVAAEVACLPTGGDSCSAYQACGDAAKAALTEEPAPAAP